MSGRNRQAQIDHSEPLGPIGQQSAPQAESSTGSSPDRQVVETELKQRAAQLALINEIGGQIASVLALDEVLNRATYLVQTTFDYHHVALFLVDGEALRLRSIAGSYEGYFPPGHTQRLEEGINGWVATHGQKLLANDVRAESRYISLIPQYTVTRAEICLPVKVDGQTIGVFDIQSPLLNAFAENDVVAMEALTNQIAVAIKNASLFEAAQQELAERKRVELALKQERDRAQMYFEIAGVMLVTLNLKGEITLINQRGCEILGYEKSELVGQNWFTTCVPETVREEVKAVLNRVLAGETEPIAYFENPVLTKSGEERTISWYNTALTGESGAAIGLLSSGEDVTERKQMEERLQQTVRERTADLTAANQQLRQEIGERKRIEAALKEDQEKYRALIEQSSDAIFLLYGGKFEIINRRFEELFGVTQEMANRSDFLFSNILTRKSEVPQDLVLDRADGQTGPMRKEFTAVDKAGNKIEIELTLSYPSYRGGLATQGAIRDISERKRIEAEKQQAYHQAQQYATKLAEQVSEAKRQREIATILAEVVASVSLTLSTDELLDHILRKLQQLIPFDSASIFLVEGDALVIKAGRGFETEVKNQQHHLAEDALFGEMGAKKSCILIENTHTDPRYQFWLGTEKVKSWVGAPLVVAQQVIGYLAVDRHTVGAFTPADVELIQAFAHQVAQTIYNARLYVDLRDAQAQLIQRERLAALGQMAATVAHELRNPLMGIRMGVEYFVRDVLDSDPRRRAANLMQANIDRIDRIVEDILYVARAPEPELSPTSLRTVIQDELARWEISLAEKNIQCHPRLEKDLPPLLLDPDQMARLFTNLISNSLDAVAGEGTIRIELFREEQTQVVIFADNGPGMTPEQASRIFEPFFTTKSRGTGLGLSIVKQIVAYHQGTIEVWSKQGQGTRFTITLPQSQEDFNV